MCLLADQDSHLAPDGSDDDGDRTLTADDERDFEDQRSPPPSPMQHYPASQNLLVHFFGEVPDWSVLDEAALENAVGQLPVPLPGPGPQGIRTPDQP
jgi:hypothetical protein